MELTEAIQILRSLASGKNPKTGEPSARESVFEEPKVIRALYRALDELERQERSQIRRKRKEERRQEKEEKRPDGSVPRNAGRPWDREGDARLIAFWDCGATVDEIAAEMERSRGSIASRLVRLGKVADRDQARARGRVS